MFGPPPWPRQARWPTSTAPGRRVCPLVHAVGGWMIHFPAAVCKRSPTSGMPSPHEPKSLAQASTHEDRAVPTRLIAGVAGKWPALIGPQRTTKYSLQWLLDSMCKPPPTTKPVTPLPRWPVAASRRPDPTRPAPHSRGPGRPPRPGRRGRIPRRRWPRSMCSMVGRTRCPVARIGHRI